MIHASGPSMISSELKCLHGLDLSVSLTDRNVLATGFECGIPIARIEPVTIRDALHVEVAYALARRWFEMQATDKALQELPAPFEVLLQVVLAVGHAERADP